MPKATIRRRMLAQSFAWTAPAVIMLASSPAYAASACVARSVPIDTTWSAINDIQGTHASGSPQYRSPTYDKISGTGWDSNSDTNPFSTAKMTYVEYSISKVLDVKVPGSPINFSFTARKSYANNAPTTSLEQRMTVLMNNQEVKKYSTRPAPYADSQYYPDNSLSADQSASGFTRADGHYVLPTSSTQIFTYTPLAAGTVTFTLKFWKAINTTGRTLSMVSPYDSTKTAANGNDKLSISGFSLSC